LRGRLGWEVIGTCPSTKIQGLGSIPCQTIHFSTLDWKKIIQQPSVYCVYCNTLLKVWLSHINIEWVLNVQDYYYMKMTSNRTFPSKILWCVKYQNEWGKYILPSSYLKNKLIFSLWESYFKILQLILTLLEQLMTQTWRQGVKQFSSIIV